MSGVIKGPQFIYEKKLLLLISIFYDYRKLTDLLFEKNCMINIFTVDSRTPLIVACMHGNIYATKKLLKNEQCHLNIDHCDIYKRTALFYAAIFGEFEIVKLLTEYGANISKIDNNNQTILYYAIRFGHNRIAKFLINNGAHLDIVDKDNNSAFYVSIINKNIFIANILIDRVANIEYLNKNGETSLILATKHNLSEIIDKLLNRGADINTKDIEGRTPVLWSLWNSNSTICKYIFKN